MTFPMRRKTGDGCLPASSSPRKDVRPLNDNLRPDDAVLEQIVVRKRMSALRTSLLRYAKAKAGEGMSLLLHASSPSLYGSLCRSFLMLKSSNPISVLWMLSSVLIQLPPFLRCGIRCTEDSLFRTRMKVSVLLLDTLKSSNPNPPYG